MSAIGRVERLKFRATMDGLLPAEVPDAVVMMASSLDTGAADHHATIGSLGADVECLAELIRALAIVVTKI